MQFQSYVIAAVLASACVISALLSAGWLAERGWVTLPTEERVSSIDGLRGYLALSVALHHSALWIGVSLFSRPWASLPQPILNQLGSGAVALFFMITGSLFYPRVLTGFKETDWRSLIVNRLLRIGPLLLLNFFVITSIVLTSVKRAPDLEFLSSSVSWLSSWDQPDLLGFPDTRRINAGVLWSLGWEWFFYFGLLPASALLRDGLRGTKVPPLVIPVSLIIISVGAQLLGVVKSGNLSWPYAVPLFAAGMIAHEVRSRSTWRAFFAKRVVGCVVLITFLFTITTQHWPYASAMPIFSVFFVCVTCGRVLDRILLTKAARALGELSFAIYLFHGIVLWFAFNIIQSPLKVSLIDLVFLMPTSFVAIVFISAFIHQLVELPAMRVGRATWGQTVTPPLVSLGATSKQAS